MYLEAPVNRVAYYDLNVPLFGREMMYFPSQGRREDRTGFWNMGIHFLQIRKYGAELEDSFR